MSFKEDKLQQIRDHERQLQELVDAAESLYDNRLGWSDGRNPYSPPEFWDRLGKALEEFKPERKVPAPTN